MSTLPRALFVSHGSPMLALEDGETTDFLRGLSAQFPRPRAIIAVSAHWETDTPEITGEEYPETIHDFYGFPPELYALRYPAPGSAALATQLKTALEKAGIPATINPTRGYDHGAWNPLMLMYPDAAIPVIQLSVQPHRDAAWHYRLGQALATFAADDVLVFASGNLTHNLREAFRGHHPTVPAWVSDFAIWVKQAVEAHGIEQLLAWETTPHAKHNHPTPEHFLPFFVALGAAGTDYDFTHLHENVTMGVLAMDAYAFHAPISAA